MTLQATRIEIAYVSGKNLLVTGGSGFIGTVLLRQLLLSHQVGRIVNLDLKDSPINDGRIRTVRTDIRSASISSLRLDGEYHTCIHLAALCKEPGFEWDEYFETNSTGTDNVVSLCEELGIQRILFTSTMMVYRAGEIKRTEKSLTAPDTAYGISKLLAEKQLLAWAGRGPCRELKIIRPAVVFGEAEAANFTRLYRSLKRGFFPYVGKSTTVKANVYVNELVAFVRFLLGSETEETIYNLAFPEEWTMKGIVSEFKHVFGMKSFNPVLPKRPLLWISYILEFLNALGLKNGVHHRRIEKLYYSTDVYPANALKDGYEFRYDLRAALLDWKDSGDPNLSIS